MSARQDGSPGHGPHRSQDRGLFRVDAAELGAFFGLLRQPGARGEVWIDVIRSPHTSELVAVDKLSRRQAVALGMMRALVEG